MTPAEARDVLAQVMGVDQRMINDSQVRRFLAREHLSELVTRQDELERAIASRPPGESGWKAELIAGLRGGPPRWTRVKIDAWLQSRIDYLPERMRKERTDDGLR